MFEPSAPVQMHNTQMDVRKYLPNLAWQTNNYAHKVEYHLHTFPYAMTDTDWFQQLHHY